MLETFVKPELPPAGPYSGAGPKAVWIPLPGSQTLALTCPCNYILYDGSRGPGKTDAQLMFFKKYVGMGYGRFWRGIIFDREYKNLDDLVSKSNRWFPQFRDGAVWHSAKSDYKWTWPGGEELMFRSIKSVKDYWNYHGQEFPFIGWNELTKYPTPDLYDMMMSCNRSSFVPSIHSPHVVRAKDSFSASEMNGYDDRPRQVALLPELPLVVFATTNPYGAGHAWVKERFVDVGAPGQVVEFRSKVFNPRTQQEEVITKTQVRIFGSYKENVYLSPEYIAELERIPDDNMRKAWLEGNWDITAGGAFDDLWDQNIHIKPRFKVPPSWRVDRSFDWGSSKPFSVGWWAESDGTEAWLSDGSRFCPPAHSLIRIAEWYGSEKPGSNKGLRLPADIVAQGIKAREQRLIDEGWVQGVMHPGPADNAIRDVSQPDEPSVEDKMLKAGVAWEKSDKSSGSRRIGLDLFRSLLYASVHGTEAQPQVYVMDDCKAFCKLLPALMRDENNPEDVDTTAEDHVWDETRYRVLKNRDEITRTARAHFALGGY